MGEKIPEAERPPVETLEKFLAVSPEVRAGCTVDLQNDCACASELFDIDPGRLAVWIDGEVRISRAHRAQVPMQDGVLTDDVVAQVLAALGVEPSLSVIVVNLRGWGFFSTGRGDGLSPM